MKRDFIYINGHRVRVSDIVHYAPQMSTNLVMELSDGKSFAINFDNTATRDAVLEKIDGVCNVAVIF